MKTISEKRAGKVMSGTLMVLGNVYEKDKGKTKSLNIGQFTNQIVKFGKAVEGVKNFTYYFAESGDGAGGGRLRGAMAMHAVKYIRRIMRGNREYYTGPPLDTEPYAKHYWAWKKASKYGNQPIMALTGTTADAIGVLRSNIGGVPSGVSIGVRQDFSVMHPWGGKSKAYPYKYAILHELGYGVPQRPIITGSMASWIGETSDDWAAAFNEMMYQGIWSELKEKPVEEVEDSIITNTNGESSSTLEIAADAIATAAWLERSATRMSKQAEDMLKDVQSRRRKAGGIIGTAKQVALLKSILRKYLKGSGLSSEEKEEVIEAAFSGHAIDYGNF